MLSRVGLLVLIYHVMTGIAAPATYDQRQTGDLNVQVHWKDLQIIALFNKELLDDYTEYDYFYDYADFTVKPTEVSTTANPEAEASPNSTQSLPSSSESSLLNSTVEASSESPLLNSTVEESSESSLLNSTVEDLNESPLLNSTVEDSGESPLLNSTVEDSKKSSVSNSTVEDPGNSSPLKPTVEDLSNSSVLNSIVENSSGLSTVTPEGSTKATIINMNNTSVDGNSGEQHLGTFMKKRCRLGCPGDRKGHCCRMSNRRLSLVPLAMKLAPQILDSLVHGVKHQPS